MVFLLSVAAAFGLHSDFSLRAEQNEGEPAKTEKKATDDLEWDDLFPADEDRGGRGNRREARRDGDRRHHDGPPRNHRRDGGPRDHMGGSDGRARGGPGRGHDGFHRQVPKEALIEFLQEHEPDLAAKLASMEQENRQYRRQINTLRRLYGPVYFQMQRNPEMGELGLAKIRIQLKTKNHKSSYQKAAGAEEQKAIKKNLRNSVSEMFDLIIQQEQLRYREMTERFNQWDQPEAGEPHPEMDEDHAHKRDRRQKRFGNPEKREKHLKQYQANIATWRKNRDKLIDQQVEMLLTNTTRPFPWPR
jgi:hypothetical protein